MIIKLDNPQFYYDLFYQLSFLIVIFIYLFESYKRKIPWITILLVVVTTHFFLIVGSRVGGIEAYDIDYFFQHWKFPKEHVRNMGGALLFALIGMGIAKLLLKIKYPILDVFAIAAPFGMAIQRVGCLLTGCCFGNETHLPIAVQYGANTPAFIHEFQSGRVGITDELSLHIHPIPLYIMIYSLMVGLLLIKYRNFWKRPGNLMLSSLLLTLAGWFVIEFFRDPLSHGAFLSDKNFGLKNLQLIYLTIIPMLAAIIYYREKHYTAKEYVIEGNHPVHNSIYLFTLIVLLIITRNWFSIVEFSTILVVLIPVSIGIVVQVVRHLYSLQVKISVAILIMFSFVLMGQTLPKDEKKVYQSIKIGYAAGNVDTEHNIGIGEGCDRVDNTQVFQQKYKVLGAGYSVTELKNKEILEYGFNSYFGQHIELGKSNLQETSNPIIDVNPFIKYDLNWVGIGGGIHIGNIRYSPAFWKEEKSSVLPTTGTRESIVFPQFYFRVGPQRWLFVDYHYADMFPSTFPGFYSTVEAGTGFGMRNGLTFRVGGNVDSDITPLGNYYGPPGITYLTAYIPIEGKFVIEPFYGWTTEDYLQPVHHHMFSIGLHYRFGHETKAVKEKLPANDDNRIR